jgi:hypothetical protein
LGSDYYTILGVTPSAEDVVIGGAYRALMRHYHPDTNPDPAAQARAREITAAYAVLRDPNSRAAYDAGRAAGLDPLQHYEPRQAPPMRAASIISALLAFGLVAAVWAWPRTSAPERGPRPATPEQSQSVSAPAKPPTHLEPEHVRLARLAARTAATHPSPAARVAPVVRPVEQRPTPAVPMLVERKPVPPAPAPKITSKVVKAPAPALASAKVAPPRPPVEQPRKPAPVAAKTAPPAPPPPAANSDRLATLDRMSYGFFSQSMAHANAAKKQLLVAARDRSAAERKACRSDSCVADAYLRQIRQTSTIMESPSPPK